MAGRCPGGLQVDSRPDIWVGADESEKGYQNGGLISLRLFWEESWELWNSDEVPLVFNSFNL